MDVAEALGLAEICAKANVVDLMRIGDAARYSKRLDEAEWIYRRARARFPDDERASLAAFYLGRIDFDDRASYAKAAEWFSAYVAERPDGSLAREASGRVIEAFERAGDHERARAAALHYLQAFPDGPHAEFARSIARR
jgi:TolA-binding protein